MDQQPVRDIELASRTTGLIRLSYLTSATFGEAVEQSEAPVTLTVPSDLTVQSVPVATRAHGSRSL